VLTEAVARGIDEVRASFAGHDVAVEEDGQGGAYVTVSNLDFGARFAPTTGWIGFHLGMHYPAADVYPHFASPLARADRSPLPGGFSCSDGTKWREKAATQISRKSNGRHDDADTAAIKLMKVLEWLRSL
jgi:hypothetical protein